jgi:hypothetical protein
VNIGEVHLTSSLSFLTEDEIERDAERTARCAIGIATESAPHNLRISAMLQGERAHNGAVTRGSVGVAVAPVVGQKNLGEAAIGESADGAGISQSAGLQIEGLGGTAIRKTHAGHGVPLRRTKNPSPNRSSERSRPDAAGGEGLLQAGSTDDTRCSLASSI